MTNTQAAYQENRRIGLTALVSWNFAKFGQCNAPMQNIVFNLYWRGGNVRCVSIAKVRRVLQKH